MFLVRLIYASRVCEGFNTNDIDSIMEASRTRNAKRTVTGLLCFNSEFFLQCLEGSRLAVNETYRRILSDPRHADVLLLHYGEIHTREFGAWHMAYAGIGAQRSRLLLDHTTRGEFDPYSMSGDSAHSLLMSLAQTLDDRGNGKPQTVKA